MLKKFRKEAGSIYDEPIDKVLEEMRQHDPDSNEYAAAIRHLETLTNLKAEQGRKKVSADTMAIVVGNLLGILVIVAYEQKHVMTSKGISQLLKTR